VSRAAPTAARPEAARQRSTRQLDATLAVLAESDRHPSAEQVYAAVRARIPAVSRGTVYRNLGKLVAARRVRVVQVHDRAARYDARLDPHDHYLCTRCAMLVDVESPPRRRRGDARVRGHRVEGRTLTYLGVCRACESARATPQGR
jgi:Fe2+ or Zn2+ uptake regulation protein